MTPARMTLNGLALDGLALDGMALARVTLARVTPAWMTATRVEPARTMSPALAATVSRGARICPRFPRRTIPEVESSQGRPGGALSAG